MRRCTFPIFATVFLAIVGCEAPEAPGPKPRVTLSFAHGHEARESLSMGEVELTTAVVVMSAVELHTCPREANVGVPFVAPAYAHVPTSSTRLGDPVATDLLDGRAASQVIGEVAAPLARFCSAYVVFGPADDDVLNVTAVADDDLFGKTVVIDADGRRVATSKTRAVKVDLVDPNTGESLAFDKAGSGPMLLFDIDLPEGVEGEGELADQVLENLQVTLRRFDTDDGRN